MNDDFDDNFDDNFDDDDFENSPEFKIMIENFIKKLPEHKNNLIEFSKNNNIEDLGRLIHTLKGLGGSFMCDEITEVAQTIDVLVKQNENQQVIKKVPELINVIDKFISGELKPNLN